MKSRKFELAIYVGWGFGAGQCKHEPELLPWLPVRIVGMDVSAGGDPGSTVYAFSRRWWIYTPCGAFFFDIHTRPIGTVPQSQKESCGACALKSKRKTKAK